MTKDKNPIKVLVTGAGAPGIMGTIFSLKNNFEKRKIIIVGTDMNKNVVGSHICDEFYVIPPAKDQGNYIKSLLKICKNHKIDVLLPQNTLELEILSKKNKLFLQNGTKVITCSKSSLELANDKFLLMKTCKKIGVPVGEFYKVKTFNDLLSKSKILGWPSSNVVVKPPLSNGMRGVRIISESINRKEMFYNEKPNSLYTTMSYLKEILGEEFPELIVTEFLPGKEYTVDVFRENGKTLVIPRIRHQVRSGITFSGEVVKHEDLIHFSELISRELDMENCYGFQFKLDKNGVPKILESNPRIQGTMVLATIANANIIYATVKKALGEKNPNFEVKWGSKFLRYWGGIGISDNIVKI